MRSVGRLHVLTGTEREGRHSHAELARMAIAGGADVIQFRERGMTARSLITTGRDLVQLCRERSVRLIVNDRVDIAIAADAGGVHLGQEDFPISLARELLGPDRLIGASARTPEEAIQAMWSGADYVGAGPIFATDSKADAGAPIGLDGLAAMVRAIEIPVIAIGGINAARVTEVMETGAHGIAVIRAVALDAEPERAARSLREVIDACLVARRGRGAGV
jgi:thiamine-phosphate pyrophosphorylase